MKQRGFGRAAAALAAGVALLAGEGALSGAAAQTKTAVTANELEAILTDAGLSPTMAEDAASGSPVAAGRLGDNIIFWVRALDCAGGPKACETLMFFVNFERLQVRDQAQIDDIGRRVAAILAPLGRRVPAVVNYEHFDIDPELLEPYAVMVQHLVDTYYSSVVRYASSGFTRVQLGEALPGRGRVFSTAQEARAALDG